MATKDCKSAVSHELEHIRKLATADRDKRFGKLYRLVRKMDMLESAWAHVKNNKGSRSTGVDGMTRDDFNAEELSRLHEELMTGVYQPVPVKRTYIPKKGRSKSRSKKKRPLGIPSLRDRTVQEAVRRVLEALYEPLFRSSSHGFRPKRSTISALRHTALAYKAGASWIIEGDIEKCFDSIPHHVVLNLLRKRIKDERFIDLIRRFLQAGFMKNGHRYDTYSGTPQGGIVSPILANIVLHELDVWMEEQGANQPNNESGREYRQRQTTAYKQLTRRIKYLREQLRKGAPFPNERTAKEITAELRQKEAERNRTKPSTVRSSIHYIRYADDFLVVMCGKSREETEALKARMANWLKETLGLTLNEEKTLITHADGKLRFLGYDVQGLRNPNGTRWARLSIPNDAFRSVVERLQDAARYRHAPEMDVFANVNALARGWSQYYCYANDSKHKLSRLTGIVYWLMAHYLGRKHNISIRKMMRTHYGRDPKTGRLALYTVKPDGKQMFVWNKYPTHRSILSPGGHVTNTLPYINTNWAGGRSLERKAQATVKVKGQCEGCGREGLKLTMHHPNRLRNASQNTKSIAQSGYEQDVKMLCHDCHLGHHHGDTKR
ncbi:MAG: group II intron reverse transcriptase/maturase [Aggregatilineales bacterium]